VKDGKFGDISSKNQKSDFDLLFSAKEKNFKITKKESLLLGKRLSFLNL